VKEDRRGKRRRLPDRPRGLGDAPAAGLAALVVFNLVVITQLVWPGVALALGLAVLDVAVALRLVRPWWPSGVRL
jgi:hypothetical protein